MFKNIIIIFILFFCINAYGQPVPKTPAQYWVEAAAREAEAGRSWVGDMLDRVQRGKREQTRRSNPGTPSPKRAPTQKTAAVPKRRREEKEKKTKKLRKKAGSSSVPIRYSYSGADCRAVAYFGDDSNYTNSEVTQLEGLATISYSVYEAKSPVRRLGERGVAGYTKGIRTIAGSMIFLVIEDHPLAELVKEQNKTKVWSSDNDDKGKSYKVIDETNRYLSTMLKPFNIGLFYKTEVSFRDNSEEYEYSTVYKTGFNEMAHLVISGVEIISEGMVTSVNDMVTEISMQFVAHDVFNIEKQESGNNVYQTEAKSREIIRKKIVEDQEYIQEIPTTVQEDEIQEVIASTSTDESTFVGPPDSEAEKGPQWLLPEYLLDMTSVRDNVETEDAFPLYDDWVKAHQRRR